MKKIGIFLAILCHTCVFIFSQSSSIPDPTQTILPPSPTSMAFAKYVDYPVDYSTGTPQINIPLYELKGKGISVPISLSYHAGGVKVDEVASNVGLGWSLNAGGVITRTVRGKADEDIYNGYFLRASSIPYPLSSNPDATTLNNLKNFANGTYDGEPDQFSFNFMGYSGKFVFQNSTTVKIIPHQDIKITPTICISCNSPLNNPIIKFLVVTPDGMQYTFGSLDNTFTSAAAVEYSQTQSYSISGGCVIKQQLNTTPVVTAWYLKRIYNPRTGEQIDFTYSTNTVTYDLNVNETYRYRTSGSCSETFSSAKCIVQKTDNGRLLSSISSSFGSVEFTSNSSRSDLVLNAGSNRITEVIVKGRSGTQLKKYNLIQSFIQSSGTTPSTLGSSAYRMYLDEVQELNATSTLINSYIFTYWNRDQLPRRLSYKQDHWGYYNSNPASQLTPIPSLNQYATLKNFFPSFSPAYRNADESKNYFGTLKRITYPTGGFTDYEYEGNKLAVCQNISRDTVLTPEVSLTYSGAPAFDNDGGFQLDVGQTVTVTYHVIKNGLGCNGAYALIRDNNFNIINDLKWGYCSMNPTPDVYQGTTQKYLAPGFYRFDIGVYTTNEYAYLKVEFVDTIITYVNNKLVGGIRIKQITTDDNVGTTANNIVRAYKYNSSSGGCTDASSAILLGDEPKYVTDEKSPNTACSGGGDICDYTRVTSSSIHNLANSGGNIVNYQEVWEWDGINAQNGKKYFKYQIIQDGDPENGPNYYNVFLNAPSIDFSWKNGKLVEEKIFNSSSNVQLHRIHEYELNETVNKTSVKGIVSTKLYDFCSPQPNNIEITTYSVQWYDVISQWVYLKRTTERQYNLAGSAYVEIIRSYGYERAGGSHTMSVVDTITNSDGILYITRSKYAPEYNTSTVTGIAATAIKDLKDNNMISQPIEVVQFIKKTSGSEMAIGGTLTKFKNFGGTLILPNEVWRIATTTPISSFTWSNISSGNFTQASQYYKYQILGKYGSSGTLEEYNRDADQVSSLIWGNSKGLPIAHIKNAQYAEVAYSSFEEQGVSTTSNGEWAISSTGGWSTTAGDFITGKTGLILGTTRNVQRSNLGIGDYVVSCWYKGGQVRINGNDAPSSTGWNYFEKKINFPSGSTNVISVSGLSGSVTIDELRLHPADALMTTYTYDHNASNLLAIANENSLSAKFEYDPSQRLQIIRDMDDYINQTYTYYYQPMGSNINYIRANTIYANAQTSFSFVDELGAGTLSDNDRSTVFQYFDGLGRPIQTASYKGSPTEQDMVAFQEYDLHNREVKKFLPYTNTPGTSYRTSPNTQQVTFFTGTDGATEAAYAFMEYEFDNSPLNRVKKEKPVGSNFSTHPKEYIYEVNSGSDVRYFLLPGATYSAGQLLKSTVKDENGNSIITYTDKIGRTVMTDQGGAKTYYIYDDFGNVIRVITPEGSKLGHTNTSLLYTDANITALSYQYTYDARQRLVTKVIPGTGTYTYSYDRLDRPVLVKDATSPSFSTFTKYDILGRPILTGKYTGSGTPGMETLYENKSATGHYYTTSQSFPTSGIEVYTVTYYDNYDFDNNGTNEVSYTAPDAAVSTFYDATPYLYVRGKVTGSKAGILKQDGTAPTQFLGAYTFYDKRSRVLQTKADNHLSGQDITWNQYNFPGWLLRSRLKHTGTPPGGTAKAYTINQRFIYHHTGRLLKTYHKMGDVNISTDDGQLIADQSYNEKDELKQKQLHLVSGTTYLQTVDYKYNMRGWLTDINDFTTSADLFALKLTYGNGDGTLRSQYNSGANSNWNGNITMAEWKVSGHTDRHIYGYFYDNKNRVTWGYYSNRNQTTQAYDLCDCYSSGYTYDDNGNVKTLTNNGLQTLPSTYSWIDGLTYTYNASGQLTNIAESRDVSKGFITQAVGGTATYTYDGNGNMITDNHKKITIAYNHLNLPKKITYTVTGNWIEFTYDATGRKLTKTLNTGGIKNYVGVIEYSGANLEAIYHGEGRLTPNGASFYHEYSIRDHLGNNRLMFRANGSSSQILQESHQHPFGMEMEASYYTTQVGTENGYKYNGKELNEDFGLNWYAYGFRWYDPTIARFIEVDPIADKFVNLSPYNYAGNSPISNIDLWGLQPISVVKPIKNRESKYSFTRPDAHLLSLVSGVDESILLNQTIIQKRAIGQYRPWYNAKKGGGAITLGNGSFFNITYTQNYFSDDPSSYNGNGYGKNIYAWLSLTSHEVGHIQQNIKEGGFFSYIAEFLSQYYSAGNHDDAPYEEEAEEGAREFRRFNMFVNNNYGVNALVNLFDSGVPDYQKINKIDKWWQSYQETKKEVKKSKLNNLLNNFQNLEEGDYHWNGISWEKKNK